MLSTLDVSYNSNVLNYDYYNIIVLMCLSHNNCSIPRLILNLLILRLKNLSDPVLNSKFEIGSVIS